jgi:predicted transcriptional regulator
MGKTNLLLSVVEILELLSNGEKVLGHELAKYMGSDSEMVEDYLDFLKKQRMVVIHEDTGSLCISDEGRKFLNNIKGLTDQLNFR